MAKTRKARSDSVAAAVDVARKSQTPLDPPSSVPLTAEQIPFFANIVAETPKSDWTPHTLELAALLAREMWSMEREQRALAKEGSVIKNDRGTPVLSPRRSAVQQHASTILSMRRSLALHARGKGGEARDVSKRRTTAARIEAGISDDGDGLLN